MPFETVHLKQIDGNWALPLPNNLVPKDEKGYVKRVGNAIYVIPFDHPWKNLFDGIHPTFPTLMLGRDNISGRGFQ